MEKFLYVFESDVRDFLIAKGYSLLKNDERNNVYIFANRLEAKFALDDKFKDESVILSNTLTF